MSAISKEKIDEALTSLPGWSRRGEGDAIEKTYSFATFRSAMDFMQRASGPIEEMDHHPDWTNIFDKVEIRLSTHDVEGVTARDVRLAKVLDRVAAATS